MRLLIALLFGLSCMSQISIAQEVTSEQTEELTPQQQRLADLIAAQRAQGGTTAEEVAAARAETARERAETAEAEAAARDSAQITEALRRAADASGDAETEEFHPEVLEALKHVPEAKPYVSYDGDFDYPKARIDLGAVEARSLRSDWRTALSEATANA